MAAARYPHSDFRRPAGSPRPRARENRDTMCRNVLIYGHCRYEDQGCTFNHDQPNKNPPNQTQADLTDKKSLSVDSPSFTPASIQQPTKKSTLSSQAANAAPFTPRGTGATTPSAPQNTEASTPVFNPATVREFTPQNYDPAASANPTTNGTGQDNKVSASYEPLAMASVGQSLPSTSRYNPYAADQNGMAAGAGAYYQAQGGYNASLQPPQYHLYAPVGPYREDLLPYQRATYDFFMPETIREEMQKKATATLQVMPNMPLPNIDHYHSLVSLDTGARRNTTVFGYQSWVYKAVSSKNGKVYCLRRLEGYRLTNEQAFQAARAWKRVINASVVTLHEAFTTRNFGDSSLIFAYDYHPCSQTLAEHHFPSNQGGRYRPISAIPENVLWGYICQICNALKAIHSAGLAARCIDISKIILTEKNRVRLAASSVLDVTQFDSKKPVVELQQEDLIQFGKAILSLATSTPPTHLTNVNAALDATGNKYSAELRDAIRWLVTTPTSGQPQPPTAPRDSAAPSPTATANTTPPRSVDEFIMAHAGRMMSYLNMSLHGQDALTGHLFRELENGRLVRLLCKLGAINERGEFDGDPAWAEHGERYQLKLFRDFLFHRVDADGNPVVDLGRSVLALNKLDAGSDERLRLVSRDEQTVFVVSYRDVKQAITTAFNELMKGGKSGGNGS